MVHVRIQPAGFDQSTGKRVANSFVQKYSPAEFKQTLATRSLAGSEYELLHDPGAVKVGEKGNVVKGDESPASDDAAPKSLRSGTVTVGSDPLQMGRVAYEALSGKKADPSWSQVRLSDEIQNLAAQRQDAGLKDIPTPGVEITQANNGLQSSAPDEDMEKAKATLKKGESDHELNREEGKTNINSEDGEGSGLGAAGTTGTPVAPTASKNAAAAAAAKAAAAKQNGQA